ncbi:hypothetical protein MIMGU_mgv1a018332mg, partial [Erythranthe guttata]
NGNESVLEGLQAHVNLKSLNICGFPGRNLPSWCSMMSELNNLMEIGLRNCKECEQIPMLGHLRHLKNLYLHGMENVKSIGSSFYGIDKCSRSGNTITIFPALERLELVCMWKLTEWLEAELMSNATDNRRLSQLVVKMHRLSELRIADIPTTNSSKIGLSSNDCSLRGTLSTSTSYGESSHSSVFDAILKGSAKSLCTLYLSGTKQSRDLPEQLQHLTAPLEIYLHDFEEIEELPDWVIGNNNNNNNLS